MKTGVYMLRDHSTLYLNWQIIGSWTLFKEILSSKHLMDSIVKYSGLTNGRGLLSHKRTQIGHLIYKIMASPPIYTCGRLVPGGSNYLNIKKNSSSMYGIIRL